MTDNKEALLRDEELIRKIKKEYDLNDPGDIKRVYRDLQSGAYVFETSAGRAFDDEVYELHEKVLSGEITGKDDRATSKKGPQKKGRTSKGTSSDTKKSTKDPSKVSDRDKKYQKQIDELAIEELKKQEKRRKLLIILASVIAVASLGYFGFYNYMLGRTAADNASLSSLKGSDALSKNPKEKNVGATYNKTRMDTPDVLSDYATLYEKNKKLAGWLKIDGTNIDYPVMQTTDNDYYLNHNFNQQKDNNGSLFLDCECSLYPQSTNMIIYGHHMKSGNMFGNLQMYAKESYYQKHPKIKFDTIYEKGTYEVMYVFYSKVYDNDDLVFKYYQFITANSEKEFEYYMSEMEKLSLYDTGVTASYGDKLLTLSTCDHSQEDGRFAVVAKKVN